MWRKEDFEELIASDCMFARKFDEKIDPEIIDFLYIRVLMKDNYNNEK